MERRPEVVASFLGDAAHVPGGFADGVAFPTSASETAALVAAAARVLPVGAQSSLTGGATPRGDLVISTRALTGIEPAGDGLVRVGAGVPLAELQRALAGTSQYYPPVPTFDGASVGGTIATNAAGPATFKYGSTRRWVEAIALVLADGSILDVRRGETAASAEGWLDVPGPSGTVARVPVPRYTMPAVAKLSAGYFAAPGMDLIDLFIGSEGTLGIVTAATLRVIAKPRRAVVLVPFRGDGRAVALTDALRRAAAACWRGEGPLDVSAVEFMDERALALVPGETFARCRVRPPGPGLGLLLVQLEVADEDEAMAAMAEILSAHGIRDDPQVAPAGDERGAARLFELREAVPASLNARIAAASHVHPEIQKTAGDLIVPFDRLEESLRVYRSVLSEAQLDYAIWGHVSDGNMHVNLVPRTIEDLRRGRDALLELGRRTMAMGGAPLAEHGVGRSALKQQMLRELYGDEGISQMRLVKRALDSEWKLAAGVLFPPLDASASS